MKPYAKFIGIIILLSIFTLPMLTCEKREFIEQAAVTTSEADNITAWEAKASGQIIDIGLGITEHGHCWSTGKEPTVEGSATKLGTINNKNGFASNLTELEPNKTYHIRAYAISGSRVLYSEEQTFTTKDGKPVLTTSTISNITINSATSGGNITDDGGDAITARGVCWNTTGDPTIADNKTTRR